MNLSPFLIPYFREAGWHEDWQSPDGDDVPETHPAREVLTRFSGIHIQGKFNDIEFTLLDEPTNIINVWEDLLFTELIGIALASQTYEELWMASDGRLFSTNIIVATHFFFVGECFNRAVENLVIGIRCRPLLRPGQTGVDCYGENYLEKDPRIYDWKRISENG
jgi:hypothetical protein